MQNDGDCLLVIDFGTSYFKAGVLDRTGKLLAFDRVTTPIHADGARREIDPEIFKATVRSALHRLASTAGSAFRRIRGITFCTQANTFILLDSAGMPLTPLIAWNDTRAIDRVRAVVDRLSYIDHAKRSGLPALPATLAMMKVNWLRQLDPHLVRGVARMQFLGDFFAAWLTGEHVADPCVAALSGLFTLETGNWCDDWCERVGVDRNWLPDIRATGSPVGVVRGEVADELGLPQGTIFLNGTLDQYAAAAGCFNTKPGDISETTGTVLATIRCDISADSPSDAALVGPAPWSGHFYHMAVSDVSSSLLEHYRRQLPDQPTFESLDATVNERTFGNLFDASCPAPEIKQALTEMAATEDRGRVVASIYQVVAETLRQQVQVLSDNRPVPPFIRCAGGASQSRRWLQIKANTLRHPMCAFSTSEPTLVGSALLATPSLGWEPIDEPPTTDRIIYPQT